MGCPGFWKKELSEKLNPIIVKKIVFINAGSGTESGLNEMLRATELKKVLKEERVNSEVEAVEELLSEIGKEGNVVYGYEDVNAAVEAGAVQKLLVTNRLIKTLVEENKFKELNELMKKVEDASGELKIINSSHEGGAKLDGLGSIGAILRYKIR